jgi:protein-disulfide isomerase
MLLAAVPAKVDTIHATTTDGKAITFNTSGKLTVVVFVSTECPVSNAYNDRMKALYSDYQGKGVQFVFLNANATEAPSAVVEHAKAHSFPFQVYKDPNNAEADIFGAETTPHVFVIGKESTIIYRGAIDDSRNPAKVTQNTLKQVLDAALAGKPVPVAETKAFGCSIKRAPKTS